MTNKSSTEGYIPIKLSDDTPVEQYEPRDAVRLGGDVSSEDGIEWVNGGVAPALHGSPDGTLVVLARAAATLLAKGDLQRELSALERVEATAAADGLKQASEELSKLLRKRSPTRRPRKKTAKKK